MGKTSKFFVISLMIVAAGLFFNAGLVLAQSLSARGVGAADDLVSAAVPQAGNIFTVIDQIQDLQDEIIACAEQGLFFDGTGCRAGVPPSVVFRRLPNETFVDVQNAFPNTTISTYALDGRDGVTTLLD